MHKPCSEEIDAVHGKLKSQIKSGKDLKPTEQPSTTTTPDQHVTACLFIFVFLLLPTNLSVMDKCLQMLITTLLYGSN